MNSSDCMGCGLSAEEIMMECDITLDELEEDAVYTNSGFWYCHHDCYRDSR